MLPAIHPSQDPDSFVLAGTAACAQKRLKLLQEQAGWSVRTGLPAPGCNLGAASCLVHPGQVWLELSCCSGLSQGSFLEVVQTARLDDAGIF